MTQLQRIEPDENDVVVITCPECKCEFLLPRWQYEITIEEEGKGWEFTCSNDSLFPLLPFREKDKKAQTVYSEKFDQQIYAKAIKGRSSRYASTLFYDALALCGSPYCKASGYRWNSTAIDFLTLFS